MLLFFWFPYYSSTPSFFSFLLQTVSLKGEENNHLVWVMNRIVCREFSHTTKYCKMFHIVITLGWHSKTPVTGFFLVHVILISSGTCANLTSSNWNDLSQRCCPLWPNCPEVIPGKTSSRLQVCESSLVLSAMCLWHCILARVAYKVPLFSSFHFCKLSKGYFHKISISLCFETSSSSPERPV